VCFSNAPSEPELIYGSAFFPWSQPVSITVGDTVAVVLQANLVGKEYIWRWDTCIRERGRMGQIKAHFKQSTFFGTPLSPTQLRRQSLDYVPTLNEDGHIEQFILALMTGETSLGEMAHRVSERFPAHFAKWQDAIPLIRRRFAQMQPLTEPTLLCSRSWRINDGIIARPQVQMHPGASRRVG
jgi:protein arginine N-methyltransferase 1